MEHGSFWIFPFAVFANNDNNNNNNPKVNNWDNYVWRPITLTNYGFNSCSFFSSVINPPLPNGQNDPTKQAVAIIYHLLLLLKKKKNTKHQKKQLPNLAHWHLQTDRFKTDLSIISRKQNPYNPMHSKQYQPRFLLNLFYWGLISIMSSTNWTP